MSYCDDKSLRLELRNKSDIALTRILSLSEVELKRRLNECCSNILEVPSNLIQQGQEIIDRLTKTVGSLGLLETVAARLYAIFDGERHLDFSPSIMFTVAGDHGVVAEGVSACKQEVTRQMVQNMLNGGAGINAMCKATGMDLLLVDAGSLGDEYEDNPSLIKARVMNGTSNISQGPAMETKHCLQSLCMGIELSSIACSLGYRSISAGEMGIGNTTPSSALFCAFLGLPPDKSVGIGSGIPLSQLSHKAHVVKSILDSNKDAIISGDPVAIMSAISGVEINVMTGIMLGAAFKKRPFIVDGFIASAAFLGGYSLSPYLAGYCFFAHCSAESAHALVLKKLGHKALLDLEMRLGEGTGAALGYGIMRAAVSMFNNMQSFDNYTVSYSPDEALKKLKG